MNNDKPAEVNEGSDLVLLYKERIEVERQLLPDEISERARESGLLREKRKRLDEDFDRAKAKYKGDCADIAGDLLRLEGEIGRQSAATKVECDWMADWTTKRRPVSHPG